MEEEGVKSAFELAMERLSRLPELTPEEIAEQKEKQYRPIGEALCNKYMQDHVREDSLMGELNQYSGDARQTVRKTLISCLCRAIQLEDSPAASKAMKALILMAEDGNGLREKVDAVWIPLLDDYEQRRDAWMKKQTRAFLERLADQGIVGSAILPNLNADETFAQLLAEFNRSFEPKLEELRTLFQQRLN